MLYGEESCRFILDMHFKPDLTLPKLIERVQDAFGRVPYAIISRAVCDDAVPAYGYGVQLLRLRAHPELADFLDLIAGMEIYDCLRMLGEHEGRLVELPSDRTWRALWQLFHDEDYRRTLKGPKAVKDIAATIARTPYPHMGEVVGMVLSTRVALGTITADAGERAELVSKTKLRMLHTFLAHAGCRIPTADEDD